MIEVTRDGLTLHVDDTQPGWADYWAGSWASGAWEPWTYDTINTLAPDVLIDVGAWVGPISMWAAARGMRVIAVEPDPVAFPALVANISASRRDDWASIHALNAALLTEPYPNTYFVPAPDGQFGDSLSRVGRGQGGVVVEGITIDRLLTLADAPADGRTVVKMDVEGYERHLLPVVGPYLAEFGIPIVVSFHDDIPTLADFVDYGYGNVSEVTPVEDRWGTVAAW